MGSGGCSDRARAPTSADLPSSPNCFDPAPLQIYHLSQTAKLNHWRVDGKGEMYSVVLMVTMSTGTESPTFGGKWAHPCPLDSCLPMRYGWVSCGPKVSYWHGCGGCGACYGCYGCYGCHGYLWPLAYGVYPPLLPCGGYGLYPAVPARADGTPGDLKIGPGIGSPLPKPREEPKPPTPIRLSHEETASIVMNVPADAEVYIDRNRMKSTSTRRVFTTPPLEPGKEYFYWVRVVVEDRGKKVEQVKKVFVRAGERSEPSFANVMIDRPALAEAAKRSER